MEKSQGIGDNNLVGFGRWKFEPLKTTQIQLSTAGEFKVDDWMSTLDIRPSFSITTLNHVFPFKSGLCFSHVHNSI